MKLAEQVALVATIDPDAYGVGAQNSDAVDMSKFQSVLFVVLVGDLGASATLDFKVQEAADAAFTSPVDLTGKAITALTAAGSDSDKQALVEVRANELTEGKRYIRGVLTLGTAGSDAAVLALAASPRYVPTDADDLASVDEMVG